MKVKWNPGLSGTKPEKRATVKCHEKQRSVNSVPRIGESAAAEQGLRFALHGLYADTCFAGSLKRLCSGTHPTALGLCSAGVGIAFA